MTRSAVEPYRRAGTRPLGVPVERWPAGGYDVAVVGAGVIGAACALACAQRGLSVVVLERGAVAGGTTGAGEGNLLVSDRPPGPLLDLALLSNRRWAALAAELADRYGGFELEHKGGLVLAGTAAELAALQATAAGQAGAGVEVEHVGPDRLAEWEPQLRPGLAGGMAYRQDMQLQPARAAAVLLAAARDAGARVLTRTPLVGVQTRPDGSLAAVRTPAGPIPAAALVDAAGAWAGEVAALASTPAGTPVPVPVQPRRGFVLVTEPLPPMIRHKVYAFGYLDDVASGGAGLRYSPVVEGTPSGTVLIGATRELVGFDRRIDGRAVQALAAGAIELFPVLAEVRAIRVYPGFRPFSPDHLPIIGPDPRLPWFVHAHGHEGAGIGLAPATGSLVSQILAGDEPAVDLRPFRPQRFTDDTAPDREPRPAAVPPPPRRAVPEAAAAPPRPQDATRTAEAPPSAAQGPVLRDRRMPRLPARRERPARRAGLPAAGHRRRRRPDRRPATARGTAETTAAAGTACGGPAGGRRRRRARRPSRGCRGCGPRCPGAGAGRRSDPGRSVPPPTRGRSGSRPPPQPASRTPAASGPHRAADHVPTGPSRSGRRAGRHPASAAGGPRRPNVRSGARGTGARPGGA